MKQIFVSEGFDDFILVSRKKPRLNASEARNHLVPSEGQKENSCNKRK